MFGAQEEKEWFSYVASESKSWGTLEHTIRTKYENNSHKI